MNALFIWLTIKAIIGLPVLVLAVYCKIHDLRSKRSGRVTDRKINPAAALELKKAA